MPMSLKSNISRRHAGSKYTVENDLEKVVFFERLTSPSSVSVTTKQIRDRQNYYMYSECKAKVVMCSQWREKWPQKPILTLTLTLVLEGLFGRT
jgi:hypothetical protein